MEQSQTPRVGLAPERFPISPKLVENALKQEGWKRAGEKVADEFLGQVMTTNPNTRPPLDPRLMAPLRKVTEIIEEPEDYSGSLVPIPGGFRMYLDAKQSWARRGFSCAHELGHTFFYNLSEPTPGFHSENLDSNSRSIEAFCDSFAASLLMPRRLFRESVLLFERNPRISTIQSIAATYGTSLEATFYRLLETVTSAPSNAIFIMFVNEPNRYTGRREKLRVKAALSPRELLIPKNISAESLGLSVDSKQHESIDSVPVTFAVLRKNETGRLKQVELKASLTTLTLATNSQKKLIAQLLV